MNNYNNSGFSSPDPNREFRPSEPPVRHPKRWSPSMAIASIALSAMAIMSMYFSAPFAALALTLALLSRGTGAPVRRHRFAIVFSTIALTFSLVMSGIGIYQFAADPELRRQYTEYLNMIIGPTDLTGTSSDASNEILSGSGAEAPEAGALDSYETESESQEAHGSENETQESESRNSSGREPLTPLPGRHSMPQEA